LSTEKINTIDIATIKTIYLGDLRTENEHLQSGNKILTDAPTDNQGKGEFFRQLTYLQLLWETV
jgi:hypothetical protein